MQITQKRSATIAFLQWASLTSLCLGIGLLYALTSRDLLRSGNEITFWGVIVFGLLGTLQWAVVLRRYLNNAAWWILASGFGWLLALIASMILSQITQPLLKRIGLYGSDPIESAISDIVFGMALGFSTGVLQWFILRRQLISAIWWLRANVLSFGLGFGVALQIFALGNPQRDPFMPGPLNTPVVLAGIVLGSIIVGVTTGVTMVWLLRDRI